MRQNEKQRLLAEMFSGRFLTLGHDYCDREVGRKSSVSLKYRDGAGIGSLAAGGSD